MAASGFYIDVGAGDPEIDSVTKLFYDAGWAGINIEPGPDIERLREARPRDTNLELAITTQQGQAVMSISAPYGGLSSLRPQSSAALPAGFSWTKKLVETARLEDVLTEHEPVGEIDFLKIDVEGLEGDVLESFDPLAIRPKVLVVEAVSPLTNQPSHEDWEPRLRRARYVCAAFDGVNRFYVPIEHEALVPALKYPISALDRFVKRQHPDTKSEDSDFFDVWAGTDVGFEQLDAALREKDAAIEAMESTLSWRATRPLRVLRRAQLRRSAPEPDLQRPATSAASARLRSAFAARLDACTALLESDERPSRLDTAQSLEEALARFRAAIASTSASHASVAWLALLCVTGSYPLEADVNSAVRVLRMDGADELVQRMAETFRVALKTNATSESLLDIASDEVLIDVTRIVSSDLHTGIQRVAREVVSRWIKTHPTAQLACYDEQGDVLRRLASQERQRILHWQDAAWRVGQPGRKASTDPLRQSARPLALSGRHPDLPDGRVVRLLRGIADASVHRSLALIGFDLIPTISAETVAPGVSELFSKYLSLVRRVDRVSTISRQSADDFRGFTSMLAGLGVRGPEVRSDPLPTVAPSLGSTEIETVRVALGLGALPLVLVVGSHEPRKNHALLLEAAERLWRSGHSFELAFVGGSGWMTRPRLRQVG